MDKLFVNGGKRRSEFMGDFGHEFGLHAVDNFDIRYIHKGYHCTKALVAFTQYRPTACLKKFGIGYHKLVRGDVLIIHMPALGYFPDKTAELAVLDIFFDLFACLGRRVQIEVM